MRLDSSSWRLPTFVSLVFHREDLAESSRRALTGQRVLSNASEDARVGDIVALQCDLRIGTWGILKGSVANVSKGGVWAEVTNTTMDDEIVDLLRGTWKVRLAYYPEAVVQGPWIATLLCAEDVKVVRRTWASPLLEKLVAEQQLALEDRPGVVGELAGKVLEAASPHCTVADPATQANLVARALVRLFERDSSVEELFVGSTEIKDALLDVWAPGDE